MKFLTTPPLRLLTPLLACLAFSTPTKADVFNMPSGQTSLQFVTVGDAGNTPDTAVMTDGTTGYGAVNHTYAMGKYDVTTAQYVQFLNAVAKVDTYGLYRLEMTYDWPAVGITRSGTSGNYAYSVQGNGNMPIWEITWGSAARFCNWLQNGQPIGSQGISTTERGAYTLNGAVTDAALNSVSRNAGAVYFIPTENEWYKAAYYKGGGTNVGYWKYATQSNDIPSNVLSATGTNNANFYDNGQTDPINALTPVGAFANSPSAYGTFDQTGDLFQWNETLVKGIYRGWRGGTWYDISVALPSTYRNAVIPTETEYNSGFRIAAVPEPSTFVLALAAVMGISVRRLRRS